MTAMSFFVAHLAAAESLFYPLGRSTPLEVGKENYRSDYLTLKGLEGVHVKLKGVMNGATKLDLNLRSDLEKEVRRRLHAVGLRMFSEEEIKNVPGQPELAIYPSYASELSALGGAAITPDALNSLSTRLGDDYHCCLSKVWTSFIQAGSILRSPLDNYRVATWGYGGESWSCVDVGKWMGGIVLETVDAFIKDYKKAISEPDSNTTLVSNPNEVPDACNRQWMLQVLAFDTDSTTIKGEVRPIFDRMAKVAKKCADYHYLIEAHADARASREYNEELSLARAQSVKLYLMKRGLTGDRIETIYYGERKPMVKGNTKEAYAVNRRIVIAPIRKQ